jgi:hypothetical protein
MIKLTKAQRKALSDGIAYASFWAKPDADGRIRPMDWNASRARMLRRLRVAGLIDVNGITDRGRWALEGNE